MCNTLCLQVTLLVDDHKCTSSSRITTIMTSQAWVADKAVPLRKKKQVWVLSSYRKSYRKITMSLLDMIQFGGGELRLSCMEVGKRAFNYCTIGRQRLRTGHQIDTKIADGKVYFNKFMHLDLALRDLPMDVDLTLV